MKTASRPLPDPSTAAGAATVRLAALTALALSSAAVRRPALAAARALFACPRSKCGDSRCAECPFARPPSE